MLLSYDTTLTVSSRPAVGEVAADAGDREPKGSTTKAASEGEGVGVPVNPRGAHPEQLGCVLYVYRLVGIVRRPLARFRGYQACPCSRLKAFERPDGVWELVGWEAVDIRHKTVEVQRHRAAL
jgi:hypothetical protein